MNSSLGDFCGWRDEQWETIIWSLHGKKRILCSHWLDLSEQYTTTTSTTSLLDELHSVINSAACCLRPKTWLQSKTQLASMFSMLVCSFGSSLPWWTELCGTERGEELSERKLRDVRELELISGDLSNPSQHMTSLWVNQFIGVGDWDLNKKHQLRERYDVEITVHSQKLGNCSTCQ